MLHAIERFDVHMVPEDGPENPLFERLDVADTLHLTILFAVPLTDAMLDRVEAIAFDWFARAQWNPLGEAPTQAQLEDETLTPTCLHLAITNVTAARDAIKSLVGALAKERVGLQQVLLGRLGPDKARSTILSLMDPASRRQTRYDDPSAWWRACFDPSAAPPLSEDHCELFIDDNALIEGKRTTFAEHRNLPLHVPGTRICFGLADFEFDPDGDDRRTLDVTNAFRAALDARFRGFWREPFEGTMRPAPYNLKGHRDGTLDRVRKDGRFGYSCLFTARDLREFLHGNVFRYREYELMLALRDTVRAMDLEPVICWKRFSQKYVVQLWERAGAGQVEFAA